MEHQPQPDAPPVYHGDRPCRDRDPEAARRSRERPRWFAIWVDESDLVEIEPGGLDALDPTDVMAWGIEFADEALVYRRDPATGHRTYGVFDSAVRAADFYGRHDPVRVIYA
ncbi:MAG: hypothetical protein ACRDPK_21160 [Carbonactinosporaceae bacterium]